MALETVVTNLVNPATSEAPNQAASWFAQTIPISYGNIGIALGVGLLGLFLIVFLFLILTSTPALTFFYAKIKKRPVIDVVARDGGSRYHVAKYIAAGSAEIKKLGVFFLTEKSARREYKTGVTIYTAFAEYAATTTLEYPAVIQALRNAGHAIANYAHLKGIINYNVQKKVGAKPKSPARVEIPAFTSIVLHELANMFPSNMTPAAIANYGIQIKNKLEAQKSFNMQYLIIGSIAIFILVLALVAMKMLLGGDAAAPVSVVCEYPQIANAIVNASHVAANSTAMFI